MKKRTNEKSIESRLAGLQTRAQTQLPDGLLSSPAQARVRWRAIPLLFDGVVDARHISGHIGFDSWAGAAVGLRDLDDGQVRRIRFDAGPVTVELVAEHRGNAWEFVARVYSKDVVTHEFVLEAGRRRLLPSADGFYLWRSATLVRRLRLIALDQLIDFGGLKW